MRGTVYTTKEKKMKDYEDHHLGQLDMMKRFCICRHFPP